MEMADHVIWKYPLDGIGTHVVDIPMDKYESPIVYHVGMQHGDITLWIESVPNTISQRHKFQVIGTGQPIPDNSSYIGTVQMPPFVWHIFHLWK